MNGEGEDARAKSQMVRKFFDFRAEESWPLLSLFALSFCKGASAVLFDTAANTHFLKLYGSSSLPMVYLAAAGISLGVGAAYSWFASRIDTKQMLLGTLGAAMLSVLLVYAGFIWHPSSWWPLAAMVWKEALFILENIVLWATAGYLFDLRQGKRLFGLVASGGIVASILGGLITPALVAALGLSQLFLLSGLALGATVLCLAFITRKFPHHFGASKASFLHLESSHASTTSKHRPPWWQLFRNRYLGLFLGLSILSNFGFFFADYVYFNRVSSVYHQEADLATFFGRFSAVLGTVQLGTSLFLAGPIITRFGLGVALMALPMVNGIGLAAAAIVSGWFGLNSVFFWLIMAIKLCDEALRVSLLAPAFRILYQPLPANERLAFQARTESVIEPMGVGLVGAVLVLLTSVWPVSLPKLCLILVCILAIWIVVAELLRHEYTRLLAKVLTRPRLSGCAVTLEDAAASALFLQGTRSLNAGEVIFCLNLLEETGHGEWTQKLGEALHHPDEQVREYCLGRIEDRLLKPFRDEVRNRWQIDPSPPVRRTALQTYCALGEDEVVEEVSDLLMHPDEAWRTGSILGLLRYGGIQGILLAGSHLQSMIQSPLENQRRQAAEILGKMNVPNFYRPLLHLLDDNFEEVRRAALRAAGKLRNPRLIPLIFQNLSRRALRPSAMTALRQYGSTVVPAIREALASTLPHDIRRCLIQVLGQIQGLESMDILFGQLFQADKGLRGYVLAALSARQEMATAEQLTSLRGLIKAIGHHASAQLSTRAEFERSGFEPLLSEALEGELREDRKQLLLLMAFFPGCEPLRTLDKRFRDPAPGHRARAMELLESLAPSEFKGVVQLFFDDLTLDQHADRVMEFLPALPVSLEQRLVTLADAPATHILRWTKACALYQIGRSRVVGGCTAVARSLDATELILRETAEWTSGEFAV